MTCTTYTTIDLGKPSYCFIISSKFAQKELVRSPITSFYFIYPRKGQSHHFQIQNNAYNSHESWFSEAFLQFHSLFKIGKERGGQESYYFVQLCLASKGAIVTRPHTKRCVQLARVLIERSLLIVSHFFKFRKEKGS